MGGNTPLVQISTSIITEGAIRDVVRDSGVDLGLIINGNIDPSILGQGFRFDAHFQIWRSADSALVHDSWWSNGNYPVSVDSLPGGGTAWWILQSPNPNQVSAWGMNDGDGGWAEAGNQGMYLYRAYFFVDTSTYLGGGLFAPHGSSQFAYADDHPFWVE